MNARSPNALSISCVVAGSIALIVYLSSFAGIVIDEVQLPLALLFMPWFFFNIAMFIAAGPNFNPNMRWWSSPRWPKWAKWLVASLWLGLAAHFIADLLLGGGGMAQIKDGMYVSISRGTIMRQLTEGEYAWLQRAELRLFAWFFMTTFCTMALEWKFPQRGASSISVD